jgi:sulfur carrier protein ThiS
MAKKVTVETVGSTPKVVEAPTVAEAVRIAGLDPSGYNFQVNGNAVDGSQLLRDYDHVLLTKSVKGA